MKLVKITAMLLVAAMVALALEPMGCTDAHVVRLSARAFSLEEGKKKTLKLMYSSKKAKWTVWTGSSHVKLKDKKAKKVTVRGITPGKAVIRAKVGNKKYYCIVRIVRGTWKCPECGHINNLNFCTICGEIKPGDGWG